MVAACSVAAVCAPVAAASTVSNEHVLDTPATGVTYVDESTTGTSLGLTLDGTDLVFGDPLASAPIIGASADATAPVLVNDCLPGTLPNTVACPALPATVTLGLGNDTLTLAAGLPALTIDGRSGTDKLDFAARMDDVRVDLGGAPVGGLAVQNVENVAGGHAVDTIDGDAAGNRLSGGDGNDIISGGPGANTLRGGPGDDQLTAGNDGDDLVGGLGIDTIKGGAGDDNISAADGTRDVITCGGGVDTVTADLGANKVSDSFTNFDECEEVTGAVAGTPDPVSTPAPATSTTATNPVLSTSETSVIFVPALGSIVPVLAPGPANFADLTPPGASLRSFARQRIGTVLSRGVPVRVTCKEACGISVALSVDRTAARRLKLDTRTSPVVVGTAVAKRTNAGTTQLRVKFTKATRAALQRSSRNVTTTTQVLVSDASGNGTLLSRHITLVR